MKLIIGESNYSTWSMRPWLLLTALNLEFEEVFVTLSEEGLGARLAQYSPTKRVPVLIDGDLTIFDSLAICEYISETYGNHKGWPHCIKQRALARSLVAEMHSGFTALRQELPMNIRARRQITLSTAAKKDVQRIDEIWANYDATNKGLFDSFSIVDCFYAPVAMRFLTYRCVDLSPKAKAYQHCLINTPCVIKWQQKALLEKTIVTQDEVGYPIENHV